MLSILEKIEVMMAFHNGEEIEYYSRTSDMWLKAGDPTWDWSNTTFRVKTKPMEVWINVYPRRKEGGYTYHTEEKANESVSEGGKSYKFIQVMEE